MRIDENNPDQRMSRRTVVISTETIRINQDVSEIHLSKELGSKKWNNEMTHIPTNSIIICEEKRADESSGLLKMSSVSRKEVFPNEIDASSADQLRYVVPKSQKNDELPPVSQNCTQTHNIVKKDPSDSKETPRKQLAVKQLECVSAKTITHKPESLIFSENKKAEESSGLPKMSIVSRVEVHSDGVDASSVEMSKFFNPKLQKKEELPLAPNNSSQTRSGVKNDLNVPEATHREQSIVQKHGNDPSRSLVDKPKPCRIDRRTERPIKTRKEEIRHKLKMRKFVEECRLKRREAREEKREKSMRRCAQNEVKKHVAKICEKLKESEEFTEYHRTTAVNRRFNHYLETRKLDDGQKDKLLENLEIVQEKMENIEIYRKFMAYQNVQRIDSDFWKKETAMMKFVFINLEKDLQMKPDLSDYVLEIRAGTDKYIVEKSITTEKIMTLSKKCAIDREAIYTKDTKMNNTTFKAKVAKRIKENIMLPEFFKLCILTYFSPSFEKTEEYRKYEACFVEELMDHLTTNEEYGKVELKF